MNEVRKNRYGVELVRKAVRSVPLFLCTFLLMLASCSETSDDTEEFADWQASNLTRWNSIYAEATKRIAAGDSSWKILKSWNLEDSLHSDNTAYIVVHVLNEGKGSGCPLYTDSVRVHYRGHLLSSPSYPEGYEFNSSWGSAKSVETAVPAQFYVGRSADGSLTNGFATALQHMHIGDEWEIYVPWTLGYGSTATSSIPAYSVLVFNVQLVSYFRAGYEVPDFRAKRNQWFRQ